jgi:hypothetical protein
VATVLMTWELGGGLGHIVRLAPLARGVRDAGHRVVVALRDLSRAKGIFGQLDFELVQAPVQTRGVANPVASPLTFAHLLHNVGFGSESELWGLAQGWRNLYAMVRPDVIVLDHSPTALLASRGLAGVRRVVIGSGFFCPPDESPLPNLHPWMKEDPAKLIEDERRVLGVMNAILSGYAAGPVSRVTQPYGEADATILTTVAELDHYADRAGATYHGIWSEAAPSRRVELPRAAAGSGGRKIFAYLKATKAIDEILAVMAASGHATVAVVEGLKRETLERFRSDRMRLHAEPVAVRESGDWCDFAILNGNHGTTAALLRMGKPVVQLPIFLEQAMLARAVVRVGAGVETSVNQPAKFAEVLRRMADELHAYEPAARAFAQRYAGFDERDAVAEVTRRIVSHIDG